MVPARDDLVARDRRWVWHPYTQHAVAADPLPVVGAAGSLLRLADGREVVDAISSWWTCLHGHGHPRLVEALAEQARTLDHVLFAGCTHEPAVGLIEDLAEVLPAGLVRGFYSDDGSTAVEVALKIVLQRWQHLGEPQRRIMVALEGGYHGDTFGAMAVGDPQPFFAAFAPLLFEVRRAARSAAAVRAALDELGQRAAGVIVEPLVQGAAGMVVHDEALLRGIRAACDEAGVPLIADEVMTGFGRTGALFACARAGIVPDVLCLAKGLTGGVLPLALTVVRDEVFAAFWSDDRRRTLFHGHTFTAHAIGCAVARASLRLCLEEDTPARLDALGARIESGLRAALGGDGRVSELHRCGGIVRLRLRAPEGGHGYLAGVDASRVVAAGLGEGVLLRPLGDVLYAMPPASTTPAQADRIVAALVAAVGAAGG